MHNKFSKKTLEKRRNYLGIPVQFLLFSKTGLFCSRNCLVVIVFNMADIPSSFYDIIEKSSKGEDVSFDIFRGKVVYGVNVASECGDTEVNYNILTRVTALKEHGIDVAMFPCNQVRAFLHFIKSS
jgi:hypothetical protein